MKIRVGIIFGGCSREREISFAGGRTVYDNLNKTLFEPVPLFVDSFGNFVLPDWQYIYKGSIRDFYPPVDSIPHTENDFHIYAESLGVLNDAEQKKLLSNIGKPMMIDELKGMIDFAFLCLHGTSGEDGRIQGLLEYLSIPYSGSGILSSAIGINKSVQKSFMRSSGFASPAFINISRDEVLKKNLSSEIFERVKKEIGFPFVVKSANQGSSIGISVLHEDDENKFRKALLKSFFAREISEIDWNKMNQQEQTEYVRELSDIRDGIGIPVMMNGKVIYHPEELLKNISEYFSKNNSSLLIESVDSESEVLIEKFIDGKEFSCIVIRDENNNAVALPPTEIKKGKEIFSYRSKYLPGLSRKITPIHLPDEQINSIRKECEKLFYALRFNVYARIDGFITDEGKIFLNDPNTTSGMMPSSFFFHQAAEIGLNPSQFLTYIIRTSLAERINDFRKKNSAEMLLAQLDGMIKELKTSSSEKIKVAVIMGGYSSERHISVESGRNVYEKLSSSAKYEPIPVFLTGNAEEHELFQIPINLLLKDNADDIKEKIATFSLHPVVADIMQQCKNISGTYTSKENVLQPRKISYAELAELVDEVFIALHGRPGEDGEVQQHLEKVGLSYNGSGPKTSQLTINKYETNELLRRNGFYVAAHLLVHADDWKINRQAALANILKRFSFPLIAKPVDDGCSSAVKRIKNEKELIAFAEMIFRTNDDPDKNAAEVLNLKPKEEFPRKKTFMIETLIENGNAKHFLEITGGMLTKMNDKGEIVYEIFQPSEALSEGDVLSLEEKFLAGEGQNITPARYAKSKSDSEEISKQVQQEFLNAAKVLNIEGYARIDAFVRVMENNKAEVIFIEVNSLPGMTPATCIFHQSALNGYKPYDFIDAILDYGKRRKHSSVGSAPITNN